MKRSPRAILVVGVLIGVAAGCGDPTQPKVPPTPPPNTAPIAYAGPDVLVPLPATSGVLDGFAMDSESNVVRYSWQKVDGPGAYSIESPDSLRTNLTNLQSGWYGFELAVTDVGGLTGKDTVGVLVYDPLLEGANEVVFRDLDWSCPWYCYLSIRDVRDYVGSSTAIKVFLKENGVVQWIEVVSAPEAASEQPYWWTISDGDLLIHAITRVTDGMDVMIKF